MKAGFSDIATALQDCRTVLVASHLRPDGDAYGSTLAVALWLRSQGKEVTAWNEDGMTAKFRYLPGHELVAAPSAEARDFDALVALDTSVFNRLGTVLASVGRVGLTINIDHHVSNNGYGDLALIDASAPATGQILFEFFESQGIPLTPEIAANLYAAISTDTGSFQYAGTDVRTFAAASALVAAGVDVAALSRAMYDSQPRRRLDLLRYALNNAQFSCEGRLASFSLPLSTVDELGLLPEDNEGIIDHLRAVDEVVAAVFFEELPEGKIRVSARSKDARVDVCRICGLFGGGGHPMAAGARLGGSLADAETQFLAAVCDEIRNRN